VWCPCNNVHVQHSFKQRRHADGYWKVSVMISLAYFLALCSVDAYQAKKHESKTTTTKF